MKKIIFDHKPTRTKTFAKGSNQYVKVPKYRSIRRRAYMAVGMACMIAGYVVIGMAINFYEDVKFKPAYAPGVSQVHAEPLPESNGNNHRYEAFIKAQLEHNKLVKEWMDAQQIINMGIK